METLTEKREEWIPVRVAYGCEHSAARRFAEQGYACWIPASPAEPGRAAAWVRSLLFVRKAADGSYPQPSDAFRFAFLRDRRTARPLGLDAGAMRRTIEAFAARQSLEALFASPDDESAATPNQ